MVLSKTTFKRVKVLIVLALLFPSKGVLSECGNRVAIVPGFPMKAASKSKDFTRFRYALSSTDVLLIDSHEDTQTTIGPYDTGFSVKRDGKTIKSVALRELPEFQRQGSFYSESFTTIAITTACGSVDPIYFLTMKYKGDELSPALIFLLIPSAKGYRVSNLPMISGGTVDVSKSNPLHLKVWDNLNEGMCNACMTAYRITEYEIQEGGPVRIRRYRTRHLYSSDQFGEARVRFIP